MPSYYVYKKSIVRLVMRMYDLIGFAIFRRRPLKNQVHPTHICCIVLHQIGDVVIALPTVEGLHRLFPDAKLSIIAGSGPSGLLETNPWNATVHTFDADWQKVVRQLKHKRDASSSAKDKLSKLITKLSPDMVVVLHPDLIVNQLLGKTTIPYTTGFSNAGGGFWLTNPVDLPRKGHQVERDFALINEIASLFNKPIPSLTPPRLTTHSAMINDVKKILERKKINPKRLVVLHPFASAETKNWLPERWQELIDWLNKEKYAPVIVGGPKDAAETFKEAENLCGQLTLPQTSALLSMAQLFIGIDSGPGHIAAAVGTPVISIYSSVHVPSRWAPYEVRGKTLILHKEVQDRTNYPLELRDLPTGTKGNPYIDQITVNDVIAAIKKVMS